MAVVPVSSTRIPIPSTDYREKPQNLMPVPERNLHWMLFLAGIRSNCCSKKWIRWIFPVLINLCLAGACFVLLWYPAYYVNQAIVWTADMVLIWIVHSYLLFLQSKWDVSSCFELNEIGGLANGISLTFYTLFMAYWLYFAFIMFSIHKEQNVYIQIGNVYMSVAWFFFFSNAAALYYFICTKLLQRASSAKEWIMSLGRRRPSLEEFYVDYNYHCKKIRRFGVHWNFIVFLGFLLLTLHVPIDLISILYDKNYYDIPGAVVKGFALAWYLYCICSLDDLEGRVVSTLYKERLFGLEDLQMIEKYVEFRGIGLNFYGIRINTGFIMKVVILVSNFIIPTVYALLEGIVLKT